MSTIQKCTSVQKRAWPNSRDLLFNFDISLYL